MENTDSADFRIALDDLVTIIRETSIPEVKVFANWVNNFLFYKGEKLTVEDLNKIKRPEEVLTMMTAKMERYREELINAGIEQGEKQGFEKGAHNKEIEIAINLIKAGSELEFVSKITGLSIQELQKLKQK